MGVPATKTPGSQINKIKNKKKKEERVKGRINEDKNGKMKRA